MWYYQQHKNVEGVKELFELAMESLLQQNQTALEGLADNFPIKGVGMVMRAISFPLGKSYAGPNDKMVQKAAHLISTPSAIREKLSEGCFISKDPKDRMRMLNDILPESIAVDKMVADAKKAKRELSAEEKARIAKVNAVINELVQVDVFDKIGIEKHEGPDYVRPALRHTRFANMKSNVATATA